MIGDCVVDASVGIKLFLEEEGADIVDQVFSGLGEDPPVRLYVPDLFYIECANILWKYVRRFAYPVEDARDDLQALRLLQLETITTERLLAGAFDLAVTHEMTVYDACYVALAAMLELPLLTADERLFNKLKDQKYDIRHLADLG